MTRGSVDTSRTGSPSRATPRPPTDRSIHKAAAAAAAAAAATTTADAECSRARRICDIHYCPAV